MKSCKGWTLISLMVMLVLASILILLFFKTVVFSLNATRQTVQLAQLQQAGQFVLNLFQHELRNANFMAGAQHIGQNMPALIVENDCSNSTDSGSFPKLERPFQLLQIGTVGSTNELGCLVNALRHTDYLKIKRLAGELTTKGEMKQNRVYVAQANNGSKFVTVDTAGLDPNANYWPYLHQVFYLTRQNQQGLSVPVLMRKRLVRQQNGALVMDTDSLIDGVEAMVFEAGADTNQDGVSDQFSNQSATANWQGGAIGAKVVQIRFHILLRSVEPDPAYTNNEQYQLGPRRFVAPGDHFRRLQLSSSVTFIN